MLAGPPAWLLLWERFLLYSLLPRGLRLVARRSPQGRVLRRARGERGCVCEKARDAAWQPAAIESRYLLCALNHAAIMMGGGFFDIHSCDVRDTLRDNTLLRDDAALQLVLLVSAPPFRVPPRTPGCLAQQPQAAGCCTCRAEQHGSGDLCTARRRSARKCSGRRHHADRRDARPCGLASGAAHRRLPPPCNKTDSLLVRLVFVF